MKKAVNIIFGTILAIAFFVIVPMESDDLMCQMAVSIFGLSLVVACAFIIEKFGDTSNFDNKI